MRRHNTNKYRILCFLLLTVAGTPIAVSQGEGDEESIRLYNTREERREAGLQHELVPGVAASGLLEWEGSRERLSGRTTERGNDSEVLVQLGVTVSPIDRVRAEAVLELGTENDDLVLDEAFVELDMESWGLALGRQYLPFGTYYSQFATGPLLEFGETRATAATLSYELTDRIDVSASLYRGRARLSGRSREVDWALAIESQPTEGLSVGLSYLDDLADTDVGPLADEDHRFARRVSAVGAYAIWSARSFEVSFEALGAMRSFEELDADRDRPAAWNLEFAHFVHPRFDWALRLEGSRELEDSPRLQYGAAANVRFHDQVGLTLEFLRGRFEGELALDENDDPFERVNQIGFLLSVVF